ncbi:MAG TPA: hypothetical protein VH024_09845 [Candidatus Angelobacter sp.]|nr:hypothetical protein [Candidatus Angelobacter sp.]
MTRKITKFLGYLIKNDDHIFRGGNFGWENDIDDDEELKLVGVSPNANNR